MEASLVKRNPKFESPRREKEYDVDWKLFGFFFPFGVLKFELLLFPRREIVEDDIDSWFNASKSKLLKKQTRIQEK